MQHAEHTLLIYGGTLVDPARGIDEQGDLFVEAGTIRAVPPGLPEDVLRVDATGLIVAPGLVDLHTHLREPGGEASETIVSGSRAAACGGFTSIVAMPNTSPAIDTADRVSSVKEIGDRCGLVTVLSSGCITVGREGENVADMAAMARVGAAAFTDDGCTVVDDDIMSAALEAAAALGRTVMDHALDPGLAGNGVMRDGERSRQLGLPGIPAEAEVRIVERDIRLSEKTGCPIHIQHLSTGAAVALIRQARTRGVPVTCEVTPHHLALADSDIDGEDTSFKVNPPIGTEVDREELKKGIVDGTVQALATDHAPHASALKARGFADAPFGAIGLVTAVGVTCTELVVPGILSIPDWLRLWTTGPASVLGIDPPSLAPGSPANIVLLDLETEWTFDASESPSLSRNSPFHGRKLTGRAVQTFLHGHCTSSLA